MDTARSREALAEFLDYLAAKGLMARATVLARKAAASQILAILEPTEASDVVSLDVDDVVARFGRLHGRKYTPQSLATYKSRLRSALEDFRSYLSNPLAFRPSIQAREKSKSAPSRDVSPDQPRPKPDLKTDAPRPIPMPAAASNILPIPIRADLTIFVQGLPFDLSEGEARKIAGVITAMAHQ